MARKKNNWWVYAIIIIGVILVINNQGLLGTSNDLDVSTLPPMTADEYSELMSGRETTLSRGYAVGGSICTLEPSYSTSFTATSFNDVRACYSNNDYPGVSFVLNDITNGFSNVGTIDLEQGESHCFNVQANHDYIADLYFCAGVPESTVCMDTDNRDYEVKGNLQVNDGIVYEDYCLGDGTTLVERYCDPYAANINEEVDCEAEFGVGSVCYGGRCFAPNEARTTIECATCSGDQRVIENVPIVIGESTNCMSYGGYFPKESSISCEQTVISTETGEGTYFQPTIINMWVESSPGNHDWVLIPKSGELPSSIAGNWKSSEYVDVIVEVDNSQALNYNSANPPGWLQNILFNRALGLSDDINKWGQERRIDNEPGIGRVWSLDKESDNPQFTKENVELLNAIPHINFGLLEISFLNSEHESVYGFPRFATLEGIRPVSKRDACLGSEAQEEWIDSFALLMLPPVDNVCWDLNNLPQQNVNLLNPLAAFQTYKPTDYNGFCNFKIKATVKVPVIGDQLADGRSNYNAEGKYYLQSSIYEECYHPIFGSPDWLNTYEARASTTPGAVGNVCCRTGSWWFGYNFNFMTDVQCSSAGGTPFPQTSSQWSKCVASSQDVNTYYKCDDINNEISFEEFTSSQSFDAQIWKPLPSGGEAEAYLICGVTMPSNPKNCYSCNLERIQIEDGQECPKRPAATTDYWEYDELSANCGEGEFVTCYSCEGKEFVETIAPLVNDVETSCRELGGSFTYQEYINNPLYCLAKDNPSEVVVSINPENDEEWCVAYDSSTQCYSRKNPIEIADIDSEIQNIRGFMSYADGDFIPSITGEPALCINAYGDEMCSSQSNCMPAVKDSTNDYKLAVYEGLSEVLSWQNARTDLYVAPLSTPTFEQKWLTGFFYDEAGLNELSRKEKFLETMGICTYEEADQGLFNKIKRWFADLLGSDPDSATTTIVMVLTAGLIVVVIYSIFKPPKSPSQPRPFIPRMVAPPNSPVRRVIPRRIIKRKPKRVVTTKKRYY